MTGYEALLAELEPLVKAVTARDSVTPRTRSPDDTKSATPDDVEAAHIAEEDEDDEEGMGKSFQVTLEDGTTSDVYDATQLIKALQNDNNWLAERSDRLEAVLTKALKANVALARNLNDQGAMIKSMQADLARIGGSGAGRKAVLSVHEKPDTTGGSGSDAVTPQQYMELMTKAWTAGSITSHELQVAETKLGMGQMPTSDEVARLQKALGF